MWDLSVPICFKLCLGIFLRLHKAATIFQGQLFEPIRFLQIERFEQICQGELSFSFTKVNSDTRQHFLHLFLSTRVIKTVYSFLFFSYSFFLFLFNVVHGLIFNLLLLFVICTGVTLSALVLYLSCTALSQSKSSNFFMYIISYIIVQFCVPHTGVLMLQHFSSTVHSLS